MKPYLLLVEDDAATAKIEMLILRQEGHRVRWVRTAAEAFETIDRQAPSCVLLDYVLQDGDADKIVEKIRQLSASPPVILVTASSNADVVAQALNVAGLIKKPFEIEHLLSTVSSMLLT